MCVCVCVFFTSGHSVGYFLCFIEAVRLWNTSSGSGVGCGGHQVWRCLERVAASCPPSAGGKRGISFCDSGVALLYCSFLRAWKWENDCYRPASGRENPVKIQTSPTATGLGVSMHRLQRMNHSHLGRSLLRIFKSRLIMLESGICFASGEVFLINYQFLLLLNYVFSVTEDTSKISLSPIYFLFGSKY